MQKSVHAVYTDMPLHLSLEDQVPIEEFVATAPPGLGGMRATLGRTAEYWHDFAAELGPDDHYAKMAAVVRADSATTVAKYYDVFEGTLRFGGQHLRRSSLLRIPLAASALWLFGVESIEWQAAVMTYVGLGSLSMNLTGRRMVNADIEATLRSMSQERVHARASLPFAELQHA